MSVISSSLNASSVQAAFFCLNSTTFNLSFSIFAAANILELMPVTTLVFYVGLQRWCRWRRRSTSTIKVASHTDIYTYHMMTMETFSMIGCALYCSGESLKNQWVMMLGFYFYCLILPGQNLFHVLTCTEHHLAVVHPITYLRLRKKSGAWIRNVCIGCVWLVCVGWLGVMRVYYPHMAVIPYFSLFMFSLIASCFCSFSVLHTLTRSSPGQRVADGYRVDKSKQRAFHTIVAIMVALLLRFSGCIVCIGIYTTLIREGGDACAVLSSAFWFCLPSSLVLPLLFLHRAGKLACCRR